MGACRHGDKCTRRHIKPTYSQTVLITNLYQNPMAELQSSNAALSSQQVDEQFDLFYEDIFVEMAKYGIIEEMHVCGNVCGHLAGNVYLRFRYEDDAQKAVDELNDRFYDGRPIWAELSPVTDFKEATCRKMLTGECNREGFCNFFHLRQPSKSMRLELYDAQRNTIRMRKKQSETAADVATGGDHGDEHRRRRSRS